METHLWKRKIKEAIVIKRRTPKLDQQGQGAVTSQLSLYDQLTNAIGFFTGIDVTLGKLLIAPNVPLSTKESINGSDSEVPDQIMYESPKQVCSLVHLGAVCTRPIYWFRNIL